MKNKPFLCNTPTPYHVTQYEDVFITYTGGFDISTGKIQPLPKSELKNFPSNWRSYTNAYSSLALASDAPARLFAKENTNMLNFLVSNMDNILNKPSASNKYFGKVDMPAHINTKIDFVINQVYETMTSSELNTLTQLCELERTQILTILAIAQTNPYMAGYLLTGNRSNFVHVEGSSLWLYECKSHLSPLYTHDSQCFDKIPIYYQDDLYYVDPVSRQTYNFASTIPCDGNIANTFALDPDGSDTYYLLDPAPIKQSPPAYFKPSEVRTSIRPNVYSAQDAGLYSQKDVKEFWNRILLTKHSDETLSVLGKTISKEFLTKKISTDQIVNILNLIG